MTLPATAVIEVRTTGSDTQCAGGFNSARGGTDYSQQDTAQATGTVTVVGTTATATTSIFTSAMVGNYITDGTSYREITAFTSSTVVTLDSTVAWTSATIYVGGALATPSKALSIAVGQNKIWVKAGSYSMSANPTIGPTAVTPGNGTNYTRLSGYNVTRGDNPSIANCPVITASGSTTTMLPLTGGWEVEYLVLDGATTVASNGITFSNSYNSIRLCALKNFKTTGVNVSQQHTHISFCYITGCTSAATAGIVSNNSLGTIWGCFIYNNSCSGISNSSSGVVIVGCVVASNSGASSDGISMTFGSPIIGCTIYNNGRDGIRATSANGNIGGLLKNNILVSNGGYGLNFSGSVMIADWLYDGNAYYNNTSGARNNCGTGTADITLTASPFTNAASGDFSLNNTAGAGAACRAAGIPGVFPGGLTTGYLDIGAAQHKDPGGGVVIGSSIVRAAGVTQ